MYAMPILIRDGMDNWSTSIFPPKGRKGKMAVFPIVEVDDKKYIDKISFGAYIRLV